MHEMFTFAVRSKQSLVRILKRTLRFVRCLPKDNITFIFKCLVLAKTCNYLFLSQRSDLQYTKKALCKLRYHSSGVLELRRKLQCIKTPTFSKRNFLIIRPTLYIFNSKLRDTLKIKLMKVTRTFY